MDVTKAHFHDRMMSLHRRAFELIHDNEDFQTWTAMALRLECPEDAIPQIWKTANTAHEAHMSKEQAFPLTGQIEDNSHDLSMGN